MSTADVIRIHKHGGPEELRFEKVELDELLKRADFISLHTPMTDSTRNLLNAERLAKCKKGVRIINSVPGPNPEGRRSRHSGTPNAFTNTRSRVPWQLKLTDDDFKPIQPTLIIDKVEWDGPIVDSWPTQAHQKIYVSQDAREILTKFATRAWRRPVQAKEIELQLGGTTRQLLLLGQHIAAEPV